MEKLDSIDLQLINMLLENARTPLRVMAEKVFLSSPAVSARIANLEKHGIITGFTAEVDLIKLGFNIAAFINLEVDPIQKPDFYPFIRNSTNVLECHNVTGSYSMVIKAAFPNTLELNAFVGKLQKFGKTSTQVIFSSPVPPRGIGPLAKEEDE